MNTATSAAQLPSDLEALMRSLRLPHARAIAADVLGLIRVNRGAAVWCWMALAVIGGCRPTVLGGVDSRAS